MNGPIRIGPTTDWAAILRRLYVDSPHTSRTAVAKAARVNDTQLDRYLAGTRTPNREVLTRLLPALGYDLALVPREGCPTCSPPRRETVNLVCQTCGTDYGRFGKA